MTADFVLQYDTTELGLNISQAVPIVYYILCGLGFIILVASFIVQFTKPANYGKFDQKTEEKVGSSEQPLRNDDDDENIKTSSQQQQGEASSTSGCRIPQRIAHFLSDFPPGVILFTTLFFVMMSKSGRLDTDNYAKDHNNAPVYVMIACWLAHYVHRGLITPITMKYSSKDVELGICIGGLFPNCTFSAAFALHLSLTTYNKSENSYLYDARFIIGLILFILGYIGNRWSDYHLRSLREEGSSSSQEVIRRGKYSLPTAGLFKLCYCPNYFCEFTEWVGFAILTSSLPGVLWALFGLSTFLPRSLATKKWYLQTFAGDADEDKAALIPFIV